MDYEQIYDVINRTLKFKSSYINDEVKIFINHYQKMLERNIMSNEDSRIISLCRRIYRENKEAIDLINKYANSSANNIAESLYNIVLKNSDLVATGYHNAEYTEFFQKEIADKTDVFDSQSLSQNGDKRSSINIKEGINIKLNYLEIMMAVLKHII